MADRTNPTLIERFKGLLAPAPALVRIKREPEPEMPTAEEILHGALHAWALGAPEEFAAHLARVQERIHTRAEEFRANHAEMAYWFGYERAVRDLVAAFEKWKSLSHPTPDTSASPSPEGGLNA